MTTWRCPVCRQPLALDETQRSWRCDRDHAYDVAREGYVNLLITHQRRARAPGDSADMVAARRRFLDGGWYAPLRDAITEYARPTPGTDVVDAGCGEGYYTRDWPAEVWGIDIAKPAVRLAARRATPTTHYAVASVYDMPLADASVDVVVSVFGPLDRGEFERVLRRPNGRAVIVTPGPDHLAGLAALLFDEVEPHPGTPPFDGGETHRLRYDLQLDAPGAPGDLLAMTPYAWYVGPEVRERISSLPSLSTPIDFVVTVWRPPSVVTAPP